MADKEPVKVEVVPTSGLVATPDADEKKMLKAQADQMYGKTDSHAPITPTTLTEDVGAPSAQGPNLSTEEKEFAANVAANKNADPLPEEKTPAPTQASSKPLAEAGKAPKNTAGN